MKEYILIIIATLINTFIIIEIVDLILLGRLSFHLDKKCNRSQFIVTKKNHIDMQSGYMCSAYASAYLLRHFGIEADGEKVYAQMPNKIKDGCVYPKGIQNLFKQYGFKIRYCSGNLNTLRNEITKGNPVIVMIRTEEGKTWLHYVPVVGYDAHLNR